MSEGKIVNRTLITAAAVIAMIAACICIFFGVLFIWGAFSPQGETGWITIGVITVAIGLVIIGLAVAALVVTRMRQAREAAESQTIVQKIDLSGDIALDKLKCRECGAELEKESITVKEGAILIDCPFCGSTYQVVEEPKW